MNKTFKFEISRMELEENEYGKNDIIIKQVKVMTMDGKYVKFAKLNNELLKALKDAEYITVK
jgi:hypothetical protein